jgi:ammonium transporter, Amt family
VDSPPKVLAFFSVLQIWSIFLNIRNHQFSRKDLRMRSARYYLFILISIVGSLAFGQTPEVDPIQEKLASNALAIDTFWVLFAGALVFFMQAGFAFLEAGLHSAKNCVHILMKNAGDFVVASLAFWAVGFAFMFGDGNSILGLSGFFLPGEKVFSSLDWTSVPLEAKFFFQLAFAGTAATIVSGAIGGRFRFMPYIVFSVVMTGFIYPILGHWVWGGGWLATKGFFDFAGSTVVHQVGGWVALAGAMAVGPRLKRFDNNVVNPYPPHNMAFVVLGVFILWLGWFGFNPGSTMNISNSSELVSHIFLTTNMGAVAGALGAVITAFFLTKRWDAGALFNGLLGGLVAITAPCAFVSAGDSLIIGLIAGPVVVAGSIFLEKMKIDDAVGAWPVHGLCGLWGTIALGLFAQGPWAGGENMPQLGLFHGGGMAQLVPQLIGAFAIPAVAFAAGIALFKTLDATMGIRTSEKEEVEGADLHEHGFRAYIGLELIPMNRRFGDHPLTDDMKRKNG